MTRSKLLALIGSVCLIVTLAAIPSLTACSAPVEETPEAYFRNNIVEMVVPYGPGGGTDRAARTITAYWSDIFGGTIRVNNIPGGGTIVGTNYVWEAKPDGSVLGNVPFGTSLASPTVFGGAGKKYQAEDFSYIGFYADTPPVFGISADLPYNTLEELKQADSIKLGAVSPKGGMPTDGEITMLLALGIADSEIVSGYDSTPEVGLACKRGEVDGLVASTTAMSQEQAKGNIKILCTISDQPCPLFPDVKPLPELLDISGEQQQRMFDLYKAIFKAGRVVMGPPGMDPAMVDYLREKMPELFNSKGYQALAKQVFGFWEDPVMGEAVRSMVVDVTKTSQADIEFMESLHERYIKK